MGDGFTRQEGHVGSHRLVMAVAVVAISPSMRHDSNIIVCFKIDNIQLVPSCSLINSLYVCVASVSLCWERLVFRQWRSLYGLLWGCGRGWPMLTG